MCAAAEESVHFIAANDSRCAVLSSGDAQWSESRDNVTWSVVPCCFRQYSVNAVVCSTREYCSPSYIFHAGVSLAGHWGTTGNNTRSHRYWDNRKMAAGK